MILSVGFLLSGAVSAGTVAWCQAIGGCKFGKYEAKVIVTDVRTQKPLVNRQIQALIDYGSLLFINIEEGQTVTTNDKGEASVEFDRAFYSPLVIAVVSESLETRAQFGFDLKDVREGVTLTQVDAAYLSAGGAEKGRIKLVLEVGNWSLGRAQKGAIGEQRLSSSLPSVLTGGSGRDIFVLCSGDRSKNSQAANRDQWIEVGKKL
jgi:hypothetical protein